MAEIVYPSDLNAEAVGFLFQRTQAMGPETIGGGRQVFAMPPGAGSDGRWTASVSYRLLGPVQVRAFRLLIARLQGMVHYTRVPVCDVYSLNHAATANPLAAAAAKASVVRFVNTVFGGQAIPKGSYIGIDGWLHQVTEFDISTPGEYRVTIEPSLRQAITTGSIVTTKPTCLMRLASADQGQAFLQLGRSGNATLNFMEAFDPLWSLA